MREREREIRLILRSSPAVNAVNFQRDAERLTKQQKFQRRNIACNY